MKLTKYLPLAALALLAASCSEEPQLPPVTGPVATYEPNTTILELKQKYWQTDRNYVNTVGMLESGDSIIIHGTVISSDESGNIYKSLMINDGTSALTVAVNAKNMYKTYQYGQDVVINVTGLKLGGYNGLMQLGGEGEYNGSPSMTFMAEADMTSHAQQNGWGSTANVEKMIIDTDIATLNIAKASAEGLQNWQSQLVRLKDLHFEDAGEQFAPSGNTNRYLVDPQGNRINLRCSSYSDFAKTEIPSGSGTVTAILSYYGSDWQMLLIDLDDLQGFDSSDDPDEDNPSNPDGAGSKEHPLTVSQTIALGNPGTADQWVSGVIVGVMNYVDGEGNVFSDSELTTNSNIVIAESAESNARVAVQLPKGEIRDALNLVSNPSLKGKTVSVCGSLEEYCKITGVKNTSAAIIDGKEIGSAPESGSGSKYSVATEVVSGGKYVLWADNTVSNPMPADKNYNYLYVTKNVKPAADGTISTSAANAYTFTQTDKGWTIQDSQGIYLYMEGTYTSFQLSKTLDEANTNFYWTITPGTDGRFEIVNAGTNGLIQYFAEKTSYGCYTDRNKGELPYLYQPAK